MSAWTDSFAPPGGTGNPGEIFQSFDPKKYQHSDHKKCICITKYFSPKKKASPSKRSKKQWSQMYLKPMFIPYTWDMPISYILLIFHVIMETFSQIKETMLNFFFNIFKERPTFGLLGKTSMVYWPCCILILPFPLLSVNFSFGLWNMFLVFCTSFGSLSRVAVIFPLRLHVKFTPRTPGVGSFQLIQVDVDVRRRCLLLAQVTVGKVFYPKASLH